ncbi:MAG: NAD(P)-dependent oxidoreductase [Proteobacteria bacterium]|nr:NAD(P)-dependent oxidoreductase [Pseudomonadota bacterium]
MARVSFLGLGVMGYSMAGHLSAAGHDVTVFNRTAEKAECWLGEHAGRSMATPRDAARGAEIVFSCVGNDDDLREIVVGAEGALEAMERDAIYVDHTTTSAAVSQELAAVAAERDVHFIDAPVSGGQSGAENGELTVMCGAEDRVFERARPVIDAYARACVLMGPVGSGQLTKMVNQICVAGVLQGLAEALDFGARAKLDMNAVIEVISRGAAQSWQMDNRGGSMCRGEFDFGFAVDWMRKDLGIVLAEAARNGARLPVTTLIDGYYAQVQNLGGQRWDTSSLIELLRRN